MTGQLPRIGVFATLGLPGRSEVISWLKITQSFDWCICIINLVMTKNGWSGEKHES